MFFTKKQEEELNQIIKTYGANAQIDMMIEEMSELTKALLKLRRDKGEHTILLRNNVIDELADVEIMCRQMEILFKAEGAVAEIILYKINRQKERMKQEG